LKLSVTPKNDEDASKNLYTIVYKLEPEEINYLNNHDDVMLQEIINH